MTEQPMESPLIGLTTSRFKNSARIPMVAAPEAYVQAAAAALGTPVLIPTGLPAGRFEELASRLDGILFTGGGDLHPARYGGANHARVDGIDEGRDDLELALASRAFQDSIPFLGICRGAQLVNVALGGSLYADIAEQYGRNLRHDWMPDYPRTHIAHNVKLQPGSRMAEILGQEEVEVNSLHHQAVRQLAPGLTASGFAPDGIIEALELAGHPFGMAVQWHPEWLTSSPAMRRLFEAFIAAARIRMASRG